MKERFYTQLEIQYPMLYSLIGKPNVLPAADKIFRALSYFKPVDTKVIIIGQDPYPNFQDACGLAFSVEHSKYPSSLKNIFKELENDLGFSSPRTGNLEPWVKQGVLLLNSIFTVEQGKSLSHKDMGWEKFTTGLIQHVINYENPIVIICWGKYAQNKLTDLNLHDKVKVIIGGHPSPLGNPKKNFFGRKYFSETNKFLKENRIKEIDWSLE